MANQINVATLANQGPPGPLAASVANPAALGTTVDYGGTSAAWPTGVVAYVQSTKQYWTLDRASSATPDGSTVVAAQSGVGRWLLWSTQWSSATVPAPASPAEGDSLIYDAGTWTRLPVGSAGQALGVAAGKPAWVPQGFASSTVAGLSSIPDAPLNDGQRALVTATSARAYWVLSKTSTLAADATTVVATQSGTGRWILESRARGGPVPVTEVGADPTGSVDSSGAANAAAAALNGTGVSAFVPGGTYRFDTPPSGSSFPVFVRGENAIFTGAAASQWEDICSPQTAAASVGDRQWAARPDRNSLVSGGLDAPEWQLSAGIYAPLVRRLAGVSLDGYQDLVWVNQDHLSVNGAYLERPFYVPAGVTAIELSIPSGVPGGGTSGTFQLQVYDASGAVQVATQTFTPTATVAAFTTSAITVTPQTEYRARIVCNTGTQADYLFGRLAVTPTTSSVAFWTGGFQRLPANASTLIDNNETGPGVNPRYWPQSAFAHLDFVTDAPEIAVETYNDVGNYVGQPYDSIAIFVGPAQTGGFRPYTTIDPAVNTVDVNLVTLPPGPKRVMIVAGPQAAAQFSTQASPRGTRLCGVYAPASATMLPAADQPARDVICIYGDSKLSGYYSLVPARDSISQLLRSLGYRVVNETYGGRSLFGDVGNAAYTVANCLPFAQKLCRNKPSTIVLGIGRNDFTGATYTQTNFGTMLGALIDAIRITSPTTKVAVMTWTSETSEANNGNGDTWAGWLGEMRLVASGVSAIPGPPLLISGTVTPTNGSASISFQNSQRIPANTPIVFASQQGTTYYLLSPVDGTSGTLTSNFTGATGATNATVNAQPRGDFCAALEGAALWSSANAASYTHDGVHPNDLGQSLIVQMVAGALRQWTPLALGAKLVGWYRGRNMTPASMGPVTATGTSPPTLTLSGTPSFAGQLLVTITTAGALGNAKFSYSIDGGNSWLGANIATAASVVLGNTGVTAEWAAGTASTNNVYTANAKASAWADLSGTGNAMAQATDANRFLAGENLFSIAASQYSNGNPLGADGAQANSTPNSYFSKAIAGLAQPFTVYLVGKLTSAASVRAFMAGDAAHPIYLYASAATTVAVNGGGSQISATVDPTKPHTYGAVWNNTSGILRIDGAQAAAGAVGTNVPATLYIGGDGANNQWFVDDCINEVLVINGTLSTDEQNELEQYLRANWGTW